MYRTIYLNIKYNQMHIPEKKDQGCIHFYMYNTFYTINYIHNIHPSIYPPIYFQYSARSLGRLFPGFAYGIQAYILFYSITYVCMYA